MPASNLRSHSFAESDRLFFDTNIWYYLYGPESPQNTLQKRMYSSALKEIITQRSQLFIDVSTLSEFINKVARFHYDLWCNENNLSLEFKQFRSMAEFNNIAREIEKAASLILLDARCIESGFTKVKITDLLHQYTECRMDFNDLMIVEICKLNHLILVTHDSDFKDRDIPILTANKKLL